MAKKAGKQAGVGVTDADPPAATPVEDETVERPEGRALRFEVPYPAPSARLINPGLGIASVIPGTGPDADLSQEITLLDCPDHRLIRSGLLLAHRVSDGLGEWFLRIDGWGGLAGELVEPMGLGDLPDRFAELVQPFRRIGALGPVAALTAERHESVFTDVRGTAIAVARDERVTVRRGGLTTARFRELTITPTGPGLNDAQRTFLIETLGGVGASRVEAFPPLAQRLGPPANGRSDYPRPRPLDADASAAVWLANLIAARLRTIVEADLVLRQGGHDGHVSPAAAAAELTSTAARLRTELAGAAELLDPAWYADIDDDLAWLAATDAAGLPARLRGERYLTLLELLVSAARGPRITDAADEQAKPVLRSLLTSAVDRVAARATVAAVDGPNEDWRDVASALDRALAAAELAAPLVPKASRKVHDRLAPLAESIDGCIVAELDRLAEAARQASGAEAFELGRRYERELQSRLGRRQAWLEQWRRQSAKLT